MDRPPFSARSPRPQAFAWWLPLCTAAIGVIIVLYQWLNVRPLWLDEEMIALNLRDRSFPELAGRLWLDQSAPLGWLYLQRFILLVFGASELSLRALPAAFGIATIGAALYVGRRWLTTAGGTVLVLLCSFATWITFYALELKSYSVDTFWGLMLPALAVSATQASTDRARRNAIALWVTAAAVAHWFSLGALLVLPACCAVLAFAMRRRPEALRLLATGVAITMASVALHYVLSIRHAQSSTSLQQFWQFAMLPPDAGIEDAPRWIVSHLKPFADKPGGSAYPIAFWLLAVIGFAVTPHRMLGLVSGLVVASGFVFAVLRMVPLYERLSLWFVPALYLGIALSLDRFVWLFRDPPLKRTAVLRVAAFAGGLAVLILCVDIVDRGVRDLRTNRPADSNRATDDRAALAWLMKDRRPGDVLLTTRHALPAIWWYGGVSLAQSEGQQFPDGGRILKLEYHDSRRVCQGRELEKSLHGRRRMLVYLGFLDMPAGFDDLLLEQMARFGTVTAVGHFPGNSRAAIVDPSVPGGSNVFWEDAGKDGARLKGCILADPAHAW